MEHLWSSFFVKIVNGFQLFSQKLHHRCSTGFKIRLWNDWNFQDEAKVGQIIAIVTTRNISCFELNVFFYSSFYLKMDFRGVQVLNKFENFSLRDLKQQMISPVGFVSINRKDYIIDLSKCLLLWRSWSSYFNIHKYPYNQLHLYNFCKLHLVKTLLYTVLILLQILKEDL